MKVYGMVTKKMIDELNRSNNVYWAVGDDVVNLSLLVELSKKYLSQYGINPGDVKEVIATGTIYIVLDGVMIEYFDEEHIFIHLKDKIIDTNLKKLMADTTVNTVEEIKSIVDEGCTCGWDGGISILQIGEKFSVVHNPCGGVMGEINGITLNQIEDAVQKLKKENWDIKLYKEI